MQKKGLHYWEEFKLFKSSLKDISISLRERKGGEQNGSNKKGSKEGPGKKGLKEKIITVLKVF